MRRRILSLFVAVVICLGLAVPAFSVGSAGETVIHNDFLSITNVISAMEGMAENPYFYHREIEYQYHNDDDAVMMPAVFSRGNVVLAPYDIILSPTSRDIGHHAINATYRISGSAEITLIMEHSQANHLQVICDSAYNDNVRIEKVFQQLPEFGDNDTLAAGTKVYLDGPGIYLLQLW